MGPHWVGRSGTNQGIWLRLERDRAIQKLVGEKLRKGYEESSEQDLRAEVKTAQTIGHKNKIARLEWVSLKGRIMSVLSDYDPSKYVYVEVMDSWSREVTRLLISKKETWEITGGVNRIGPPNHLWRSGRCFWRQDPLC